MSSFDNIFKEKLSDHSMSVPDGLWDRIDLELHPASKNRRVGIFFWIGSALIGLILLGAIWLGFKTNTSGDVNSLAESSIPSIENSQTNSNQNPDDLTTAMVIAENDLTSEDEPKENIQSVESPVSKNSNFTDDLRPITEATKSELDFSETTSTNTLVNSKIKSDNQFVISGEFENLNSSLNSTLFSNTSIATRELLQNSKISPISLKAFDIENRSKDLNLAAWKYDEHTQCEDQIVLRTGWYGDVYASADYGFRKLRSRATEFGDYRRLREDSEISLPSFSLGAHAQYVTKVGVTFKTGINYSQINELYRYTDPESGKTITTIITDGMGNVIDSITQYVPGEERVRVQNRYKLFDIPFIVGFENWRSNKISYNINTGVFVNLAFRQRGQFMDPDTLNDVWFTSGQNGAYEAFKTNIGLSYFASMGAIYHYSDRSDIFAEATMRFYPDSFSRDDYVLIQKYTVLGLRTGFRYKF